MNLIANSGIQYHTIPLEINLNDKNKMFLYEWFDSDNKQLKLEIAHNFSEKDIWVRKQNLRNLGYLQIKDEEKNGRTIAKGSVTDSWEEVKPDFESDGYKQILIETEKPEDSGCFNINLRRVSWEKFEKRWLPFPFFTVNNRGNSEFGPINWCRAKLIPSSQEESNVKKYDLLLAFDTHAKHESDDFEDQDLMEAPVFLSSNEDSKKFTLCNDEFSLVDFCSQSGNGEWVDNYILNLFHNVESIDELKVQKPKLSYLAQYIFLLKYIQELNSIPEIILFTDKNVAYGDVDLVVDIGNSRTRGILFDDSDFTKVEPLTLQNFTTPVVDGKLNRDTEPFEMRLAFREADFGGQFIHNSSQFIYPSMVRLGKEANELIHQATNLNTGVEKITTFSSPKRFLWDNKPHDKEWEYVTLKDEQGKSIWLDGISQQLNVDGSLNAEGRGGVVTYYSRRALMTFGFLEILSQANMQVNSYEFRNKWGNENKPRKIGRIIITCPTAMSRVEQIALRKCAEDAAIILKRFFEKSHYEEIDEKEARENIKVIPSSKTLSNIADPNEWIYDEATCSQFVYLYTEINARYSGNSKEYFDFYGKIRNDIENYSKKSVTIGSVDIGGGTTDLMIAAYKYDDIEEWKLTPVPLFWESFYIAGDDLLKVLIRDIVIEGENAAIKQQLIDRKTANISELILDFFGVNNARQSIKDRQIRSEFNLQVSVPVVSHFLELLNKNTTEKATLSFDDIFSSLKPTEIVNKHFQEHFGFAINSLKWHFDKEKMSKIVERTFDGLIGKISTVLSYYGCDIVLLTGRPTSLKPLSDLFLKYYAVSPNRLIRLNNYRVGTWYPFHDGKGYFQDSKSIVAVGAMIGNYASSRGSLNRFALDLHELKTRSLATSEYFADGNGNIFITPDINRASLKVSRLPTRIWSSQLNSPSYPSRPFYKLEFDMDKIKERVIERCELADDDKQGIKEKVESELEGLQKRSPFSFNIEREEYPNDKETLKLESVEDKEGEELPISYFSLQIQSMSESEDYWLDSGEFDNLNINHNLKSLR